MHPGLPQHRPDLSAANVPTANRAVATATIMRITFFMVFSSWMSWLPASILVPWVCKCLCELLLLWVTLAHRVRYLWAFALYTFSTSLALMLLAEARYSHYTLADRLVSMGGNFVMLLVALGLVQLLRQGRTREYGKLTMIYLLLCGSQVALGFLNVKAYPTLGNALMQWSWPVFVLWLTHECRWMPWLRVSIRELAYLMQQDLKG